MDEKDFRKHLAEMAHGQHHAEQHDWDEKNILKVTGKKTKSAPRASTVPSAATKKKPNK